MKQNLYDILSELDSRRNRAEAIAEGNKKKIYESHPALQTLEEKRQDILLSQLLEILKNPGAKAEITRAAEQKTAEVNEEILRLVEKEDIDLGSMRPVYECPACGDTGYVQENGRPVFCECLLRRLFREMYEGEDVDALEGAPDTFNEKLFDEKSGAKKRIVGIRRFMNEYAEKFPENEKKMLVLVGNAGLGKSFMLGYLAKKLYEKTHSLLYIRSYKLFGNFHLHRLGEMSLIEPLFDVKVLMIDDLGTEPMTQNVTREYLFDLLEYRAKHGLFTMIAANMDENLLKERYSERISSRLFAARQSNVIGFIGEDLRLSR